jgi:hypothetical protein
MSNLLKLRSTTKNSIFTHNAIQKVFKPRFDEGRSNSRITDLTNSYANYMFITSNRPTYELLLNKNKETYYNSITYKSFFKKNFSIIDTLQNPLNIYLIDIPFLLSYKSDSSRYLWFDWESSWSLLDIQYSSASRFSLAGLLYNNKIFDFSSNQSDSINDSETYITRLFFARKNYLINWSYLPYLYLRNLN